MKKKLLYLSVILCLLALVASFSLSLYIIIKDGTLREIFAIVNGATFVLGSYCCITVISNMNEREKQRKAMKALDPEKKLDQIRLDTIKLIEQDKNSELSGEDVFSTIQDCVDVIDYLLKTRK